MKATVPWITNSTRSHTHIKHPPMYILFKSPPSAPIKSETYTISPYHARAVPSPSPSPSLLPTEHPSPHPPFIPSLNPATPTLSQAAQPLRYLSHTHPPDPHPKSPGHAANARAAPNPCKSLDHAKTRLSGNASAAV